MIVGISIHICRYKTNFWTVLGSSTDTGPSNRNGRGVEFNFTKSGASLRSRCLLPIASNFKIISPLLFIRKNDVRKYSRRNFDVHFVKNSNNFRVGLVGRDIDWGKNAQNAIGGWEWSGFLLVVWPLAAKYHPKYGPIATGPSSDPLGTRKGLVIPDIWPHFTSGALCWVSYCEIFRKSWQQNFNFVSATQIPRWIDSVLR